LNVQSNHGSNPHWGYSIYAVEFDVKTTVNGCKQFSDTQVRVMGTPVVKHFAAMLTLGAVHLVGVGVVQAGEAAALKVSKKLSLGLAQSNSPSQARGQALNSGLGLLGKVPLFRGVTVNEGNYSPIKSNVSKSGTTEQKESRRSAVNAVYGGIQISLQENLSLIYAPGRLTGNRINSESQGLYLLADRGGMANWFMGVESRTYGSASDTRRTANTAQFGLIMDLD